VRNLSAYNFHKVADERNSPEDQVYRHEHFHRDHPASLELVVRKPRTKAGASGGVAAGGRSNKVATLLSSLRREVGASKLRLDQVEKHLWQTTAQCDHVQEENQVGIGQQEQTTTPFISYS
jgi:hypothetical protein